MGYKLTFQFCDIQKVNKKDGYIMFKTLNPLVEMSFIYLMT